MNWLAQGWAPLEVVLNRYLSLDPGSRARLAPLAGKTVGLSLRGMPGEVILRVGDGAIHVLGQMDGDPDCMIRAPLLTWFRLGLSRDSNSPLAAGDIDIEGDLHAAQRFQKFWQQLDIDWEEHVSHLVGDVAAHQLGILVRRGGSWLKQVGETVQQDSVEYLQEESQQLPIPGQVTEFLADIDRLRHDVDRLRARIQRLGKRVEPPSDAHESDKTHPSQ